jgi:hypothetical protein
MLLSLGLSKYTNCAAYFISHSKTLVTNIKILSKIKILSLAAFAMLSEMGRRSQKFQKFLMIAVSIS